MAGSEPAWRIAVDTGGTFTDCVGVDPGGKVHRAKLLSSGALRAVVAGRQAARELTLDLDDSLPADFFRGWTVRADGCPETLVASSSGVRLELAAPWPEAAGEGTAVTLLSGEEAAVVAIRWLTGTSPDGKVPPLELRLATTRGTNALLERKGDRVALFVTRGFGDLLRIGNQQRADLFTLDIRKPDPLWAAVVEVDERLAADGSVVAPLDEGALAREAGELVRSGLRSAAIAFLHAYRDPRHEEKAARILAAAGFVRISRSAELSPRIKIVPRAQTAVVDAYLAAALGGYLEGVAERLEPRSLHVMTSAGGLSRAGKYRAKDSLLSGPAAGVVGAAAAGRRSGFDRIIAFDMGGTSTDVSRVDGELELRGETVVGDARLLSPSVAVETVAAGGGSICHSRDGRVGVGPESAGATPGPACYGGDGPLTLTDVNLLLGRLVPSRFPFRVHRQASEARAREIGADAGRSDLPVAKSFGPERKDAFLNGFLAIANERMAGAIRAISVRQGYDPRDYALLAFGGAGGQHALALAELLGIRRVLVPPDGALLSAVGLSAAAVERWSERQVLAPLAEVEGELPAMFDELARAASAELEAEGESASRLEVGPRTVFLRYAGQESTLGVAWRGSGGAGLRSRFESAYRDLYGYQPDLRVLEVESLRLAMRSVSRQEAPVSHGGKSEAGPLRTQPFWDGAEWVDAPIIERPALEIGHAVEGPALVAESNTVTVVENGWSCRLDRAGSLVLEREGSP